MSKRVIYLEQEQSIKSMAGNFTMKQISSELNINYKTVHAWFQRNDISPLNGYLKKPPEKEVGIKNYPSPYIIPGIISKLLTLEQIALMKQRKITPTLDLIKNRVCLYYVISEDEINGKIRKRTLSWPRQVFFYLSKNLTNYSDEIIGSHGSRDRTTVMYGVQVVKDIIKYEKNKEREVREIAGIIDNLMKDES